MLAAVLRPRHVCAQVMYQDGAAVTVGLVWTPGMPAVAVEDQQVPGPAFDDDLVRVGGADIGESFLRAFSEQVRAGYERRRAVGAGELVQHPDRSGRVVAGRIAHASFI